MTNVEKLAREICVDLGYDPDKQVMLHPGGPFMKALMGKAWERYAIQARDAIIEKTLKEYAARDISPEPKRGGALK